MLVLSRKAGEQVIIGQQIVVTVLAVRGSRVKLGFLGPGEVLIERAEIQRKQVLGDAAENDLNRDYLNRDGKVVL